MSKLEFDKMKMYFGREYEIQCPLDAGVIKIHQPTIRELIDYGTKKFYNMLYSFIGNSTTFRLQLWEMGKDWNKINDYEMFQMMFYRLTPKETSILFGDLDFSKFKPYIDKEETGNEEDKKEEKEKIIWYNAEQNILINEDVYNEISGYLRTLFNIFPKTEKAKGRTTKEWMIDEDRMNAQYKEKDDKGDDYLFPLISSCVNHPGFKYNTEQLENIGIYQFMDSVQRLNIYETSTALLKGMYSGFLDSSKIKADDYNFMKNI